jgi:hypothetical protein
MKEFLEWLSGLFEYMTKNIKWITIDVDIDTAHVFYSVVITDKKPIKIDGNWEHPSGTYYNYLFELPQNRIPKDFDWRKAIVSRAAWEKRKKARRK